MSKYKYDVAVIIINFNTSEHSIKCITSLYEKTSSNLNFQIIVIDNRSEAEDFFRLKSFCDNLNRPNILLFRSHINGGFGAGNMQGIQFADAEYLAFVNNDVILLDDCLTILIDTLKSNPEVGIVGGQSYDERGEFLITFDHFTTVKKEIFGREYLEKKNPQLYPLRHTEYQSPLVVNTVGGSFMVMLASDFYKIGGFDTNLFLYYEETDLCKRMLNHGKKTMLIPTARYIHINGASTSKSLSIYKEGMIGLFYVIRKHSGFWAYALLRLYFIQKYFFRSLFNRKSRSKFLFFLKDISLTQSLKHKQEIRPLESPPDYC